MTSGIVGHQSQRRRCAGDQEKARWHLDAERSTEHQSLLG